MNTQTGTFSWPLARSLASYAVEAYTRATVADAKTNARALVTLNDDGDIVVAFKGSSTPRDFLQDAKFTMRRPDWSLDAFPALIHAGFLEDFTAIAEAVIEQIQDCLAKHPHAQLYVTGHSLGGALAILGALEFHRQKLTVAGVYTFGQPRVGNSLFRVIHDLALRAVTYRIVNQNDLVPRTPGWLLGYRHCGQEIFLPAGQHGAGPGYWEDPSLVRKLWSDAIGLYGAYRHRDEVLITEHYMQSYCEVIGRQNRESGIQEPGARIRNSESSIKEQASSR